MAEQAAKEPSMEEILASIRKIISEDGDTGAAPAELSERVEDFTAAEGSKEPPLYNEEPLDTHGNDDTSGHLLNVDDLLGNDVDFSEIEEFSELEEVSPGIEESFEDAGQEPLVELHDDLAGIDDLEDLLEVEEIISPPQAEYIPEVTKMPEAEPVIAAPEPQQTVAATSRQAAVLTDDNTASAAAGSLGKLISTLDMGGDNTIEGLVRELLKPMIKDWLDTNLLDIVERKVEAEVERIGRMAR